MSAALKNIAAIFSIFHDGTPEQWKWSENQLHLSVHCPYLAKMVDKDFNYFFLVLLDVDSFHVVPWVEQGEETKKVYDLAEINVYDFEISHANYSVDKVEVICHEHSEVLNSSGASIYLSAQSYLIKTEDGQAISLDELDELHMKYWEAG